MKQLLRILYLVPVFIHVFQLLSCVFTMSPFHSVKIKESIAGDAVKKNQGKLCRAGAVEFEHLNQN